MIFVGGLVLLATLPENPSAWNICLRSLVCGIGFGCFQSPNNREMLSNVAREYASYASGVLSIVRTFGQCLGAAGGRAAGGNRPSNLDDRASCAVDSRHSLDGIGVV
jgi:DHA2 family multidrug resistance protein-like MFS transporter